MDPQRALAIALSVLKAFAENSSYEDYQEDDRATLNWSDEDYDDMLAALERMATPS